MHTSAGCTYEPFDFKPTSDTASCPPSGFLLSATAGVPSGRVAASSLRLFDRVKGLVWSIC